MKTFLWIIGILGAIGAVVVLYFVFKKSGADGGVNGDAAADPAVAAAQLEENKRVKFMSDCKKAGLSEVFCKQAWDLSDKKTSFSDFASTGYGTTFSGCVPFTKQQYNAQMKTCWEKSLPWGILGSVIQMKKFEDCRKKIPYITSCS